MRRPAAAAACLIAAWAVGAAAEASDCKPVDSGSPIHRTLIERSAGLFPHPPKETLDCGTPGWFPYLWRVRWDVYQTLGEWRKYGTADCWAFASRGKPEPPSCSRAIRVEHSDGTHITMKHEIDLDRVAEIVRVVRAVLSEGDRITEIQYTGVPGGGSWSLAEHGYRVTTSSHPHHRSGDVYSVAMDCTPTPCQWQVTKAGGWIW